jgi:hypothetical protein
MGPLWTPMSSSLNGAGDAISFDNSFNLKDLELLHHYSTVVAFTMTKDPRIQRMWQTSAPKEAFSHPYLMHAILAISALHLAHTSLSKNEEYRAIAIRHQDTAIAAFRPLLTQVSAENCAALCASATLTVVFGAASFSDRIPKSSPLDGIIEVCELARGVRAVVESGLQWLMKSAMEPLMQYPDLEVAPPLNHDVTQALAQLKSFIMRGGADGDVNTSYVDALAMLSHNFRAMVAKPDHPALVISWLVLVERNFVHLLRQETPLSLLIVAHFGAVLHVGVETWYIRHWGRQLVEYVHHKLPLDWRHRVAWAARKVDFFPPEGDEVVPLIADKQSILASLDI